MQRVRWIGAAILACTAGQVAAQDVAAGKDLFRAHCVVCHGVEASGGGPIVGVLAIRPANLTRLQVGNGGVFPTERVVRRIDGRDTLVSHASPMPVYGKFFEGHDVAIKTPSGQPVLTSKPIADLLAYLLSLQSN